MLRKIKSFFKGIFGKTEVVVAETCNTEVCCPENCNEEVCCTPTEVEEPTKVIEERMAKVADKKVTAKEIKSKAKPVATKVEVTEDVVVKKRKPRRKPAAKKPKTEE